MDTKSNKIGKAVEIRIRYLKKQKLHDVELLLFIIQPLLKK